MTSFFVVEQSSLVELCMHDYQSVGAAVLICATVVNTLTHRHLLMHYTISSVS